MATPTLDEIEAGLDVVEPYLTHDYQRSLLALVSHVRALENVTRMTDDRALDRIAALEAKVAALEIAWRNASTIDHVYGERLDALEAKVDAREQEMDRLRAENAAQSKALEEALLLGKDALFAAQAREQKLAEENAELRKRVAALTDVPAPEPQWPAPQPIETAPLGRIMVVFESGQMEVIRPVKVDTESSWREFLKMNKATHWWPTPPPPGGGK